MTNRDRDDLLRIAQRIDDDNPGVGSAYSDHIRKIVDRMAQEQPVEGPRRDAMSIREELERIAERLNEIHADGTDRQEQLDICITSLLTIVAVLPEREGTRFVMLDGECGSVGWSRDVVVARAQGQMREDCTLYSHGCGFRVSGTVAEVVAKLEGRGDG